MPLQIFEIVRAPETGPVSAQGLHDLLYISRKKSEWQVRDITGEIAAKMDREYERGFAEGETKQAIFEIQGREHFLKDLRKKTSAEIERLTSEVEAYNLAEAERNAGIVGECPECAKMRGENERLREGLTRLLDVVGEEDFKLIEEVLSFKQV